MNDMRSGHDALLWEDCGPPPCPWCGAERTALVGIPPEQTMRFFACPQCLRKFMVTWTQPAFMSGKES